MANHKSCEKRIRQTKVATTHNHYYAKTMRNAVRKLRAMTNKDEAVKLYPTIQKMLDKLANELTDCAEISSSLDSRMQNVRNLIMSEAAQNNQRQKL